MVRFPVTDRLRSIIAARPRRTFLNRPIFHALARHSAERRAKWPPPSRPVNRAAIRAARLHRRRRSPKPFTIPRNENPSTFPVYFFLVSFPARFPVAGIARAPKLPASRHEPQRQRSARRISPAQFADDESASGKFRQKFYGAKRADLILPSRCTGSTGLSPLSPDSANSEKGFADAPERCRNGRPRGLQLFGCVD